MTNKTFLTVMGSMCLVTVEFTMATLLLAEGNPSTTDVVMLLHVSFLALVVIIITAGCLLADELRKPRERVEELVSSLESEVEGSRIQLDELSGTLESLQQDMAQLRKTVTARSSKRKWLWGR